MAKVTIIPKDNNVGVDGEFRDHVDLSSLDPNVHAVQWDGIKGHVEYKDDTPNKEIDDFTPYQDFVDQWNNPPEPPPETDAERRARLHNHLAQLGRRRRLALVGRSPNDPDVDSAEMMLQVEQAMLQNKRETGRSNASENARLDDELEPLAVSMLTEWQAQQAIKPKIDDDTYTTEADVDGAAEWPS